MRGCEECTQNVKAFVDNELRPIARIRTAGHIRACPSCRADYEAIRAASSALHANAPRMAPDLRARIRSDYPAAIASPIAATATPRRPRLVLAGAGLALATAVILAVARPWSSTRYYASDAGSQAEARKAVALPQAGGGGGGFGGPGLGDDGVAASRTPSDLDARAAASRVPKAAHGAANGTVDLLEQTGRLAKAAPTATAPVPTEIEPDGRVVHRDAQLTLEVAKVEPAVHAVEHLVEATVTGFVATSNFTTDDGGAQHASMDVRVPVQQVSAFLNDLAALGTIRARSMSGEDLTEKVAATGSARRSLRSQIDDMEARLRNEHRAAYRREDLEMISELKQQIAETSARLDTLKRLGALANVQVELNTKPGPVHVATIGEQFSATFHDATASIVSTARIPFMLLIWVAAYAPVWLLLIVGYRFAVRV